MRVPLIGTEHYCSRHIAESSHQRSVGEWQMLGGGQTSYRSLDHGHGRASLVSARDTSNTKPPTNQHINKNPRHLLICQINTTLGQQTHQAFNKEEEHQETTFRLISITLIHLNRSNKLNQELLQQQLLNPIINCQFQQMNNLISHVIDMIRLLIQTIC